MYRVKKDVLKRQSENLNIVIGSKACFDPNFGVCYNPPSYSEQLTIFEDIVDTTSGETFSVVRHVSDIHFILSDKLSSHMDENTLRQISERLSKERPKGLESLDESVSFDAVTSRYIQRRTDIDEFAEHQDGITKTYNDYKDYISYVDANRKKNKKVGTTSIESDKSD